MITEILYCDNMTLALLLVVFLVMRVLRKILVDKLKSQGVVVKSRLVHNPQLRARGTLKRERRPLAYINDYVTDLDERSIYGDQVLYSIDYCYKPFLKLIICLSLNLSEAFESLESENWRAAMEEEMDSLAL